MELTEVVPWGRSLKEYKAMFSLSDRDLENSILGCADGPASFNAELTSQGGKIISIDPIYQFDAEQIRSRIDAVYPRVINQVSANLNDYVWKDILDIEELAKVRMDSMQLFLNDYELGRQDGRYINASLPKLPFKDGQFELALCSHYLFLYSDLVKQKQHILSMRELCRVAKEVRVYPLISIGNNQESPHLESATTDLLKAGIDISLLPVEYEFQKGATKMLLAKQI